MGFISRSVLNFQTSSFVSKNHAKNLYIPYKKKKHQASKMVNLDTKKTSKSSTPPKSNIDTQNEAMFERRYIKPSCLVSMLVFWGVPQINKKNPLPTFHNKPIWSHPVFPFLRARQIDFQNPRVYRPGSCFQTNNVGPKKKTWKLKALNV